MVVAENATQQRAACPSVLCRGNGRWVGGWGLAVETGKLEARNKLKKRAAWAREHSAATTHVPGAKRMRSPTPGARATGNTHRPLNVEDCRDSDVHSGAVLGGVYDLFDPFLCPNDFIDLILQLH